MRVKIGENRLKISGMVRCYRVCVMDQGRAARGGGAHGVAASHLEEVVAYGV